MTTKRENAIRMVQESVAGENAQDYDRMYAIFAPELTYYLNGDILAKGDPARFARAEKKTTPAIYGSAHREIQWIDGNDTRVVYQYRTAFDHNGEVFGFPPTGNRIEIHGLAIYEHDGERVYTTRAFTDQGEMNRQLSGSVRTPGSASAAPEGPPVPESERARHEAVGERLIRRVYEAENARDVEAQLACFADPLLDHFAGRASAMSAAIARKMLPAFWAANANLHRGVEEVISTGNRSTMRWHLTGEDGAGQSISQHGCSVVEHDGERIQKFWAYYPDLAQVFPAVLGLK